MTKAVLVCRREIESMFGGPLAWILAAVFAALTGWFVYADVAWYVLFGGANLQMGLWRYVFLDFRMVVMVVIPLLTMRLVAEERKLGTLELLWTFPVRDHEVLLGKFLAALAAYLVMLVGTTAGPVVLHAIHPFPWTPVLAGYLGLVLLGAAFVACGLAASAIAENQVVAAMLTYGTLMLFWFGAANEAALQETVAPVLLLVSLFDRFYGFAQGVVDTRDVAYFVALTAFFLFVAHRALGSRAWRGVA
ncbi:MAG: ABC transporter permease [Candidatus Binatia bacterium]